MHEYSIYTYIFECMLLYCVGLSSACVKVYPEILAALPLPSSELLVVESLCAKCVCVFCFYRDYYCGYGVKDLCMHLQHIFILVLADYTRIMG